MYRSVSLTPLQVDRLAAEWTCRPDRPIVLTQLYSGNLYVQSCDDNGPFTYTLHVDGAESDFERRPVPANWDDYYGAHNACPAA